MHQGKLWKCSPLAYLPMIVDQLDAKELWAPYLRYTPLGHDATDEALAAFVNAAIAKSDSRFCDMCPTEQNFVSVEGIVPQDIISSLREEKRKLRGKLKLRQEEKRKLREEKRKLREERREFRNELNRLREEHATYIRLKHTVKSFLKLEFCKKTD